MSMNGLNGFCPASRSAPSAMLTAWSPILSRSLLIFRAATRNRRSTATGCWRARSCTAWSSMTISIRSISASAATTSAAFFSSTSVSASMERWIWRSTSPPMRIRFRRSSSSCSEKCSLTMTSPFRAPGSAPERRGGNRLHLFLESRLVPSCRKRPESGLAAENTLEEIGLPAGGLQLDLAVGRRERVELDALGPEAARDVGHQLPVAVVEAVGDAQDRGELLDDHAKVGIQPLPVVVGILRAFPLVVPGNGGDRLDLVGREPRQLAVRDQVVGVPLVARDSDRAAHVVQKSAVPQPLPLGGRELVQGVGLVEDRNREASDALGVGQLRVGPPEKALDAVRAQVPVSGAFAVARHVVEQDPLPHPALADDDRLGAGRLQDPG